MALSASTSLSRFAGSGPRAAPPEVVSARLVTCSACPDHTDLRCRPCDCFTAAKARLPHERCPAGQWTT
jgi:hypothetical protein